MISKAEILFTGETRLSRGETRKISDCEQIHREYNGDLGSWKPRYEAAQTGPSTLCFCSGCGNQIAENLTFCANCGSRVGPAWESRGAPAKRSH